MDFVEVIAVENLPLVTEGDDIAELICSATEKQNTPIQEDDIIVVTHVTVSKAEGNLVNLDEVVPSAQAIEVARKIGKEPALVETILRQTTEIVRMRRNSLITETKDGIVCANAGVDKSNVRGKRNIVLLPKNANESARKIRQEIKSLTGCDVAVIISDTHGRPFRMGEINVAIGIAGIKPIRDRRGEKDLFGYILKMKRTAVADELASAAELVMGQADEGIPVAIIRGYRFEKSEKASATELNRPKKEDLFR